MITRYRCRYLFADGSDFAQSVSRLLEQILFRKGIVRLVFFGKPEGNIQYQEQLGIITEQSKATFGKEYPLISYVVQPVVSGASIAVEVHSIETTNDRISYRELDGERYIVVENDQEKILMIGALRDEKLSDCIRSQSDVAFAKAEKILHAEGLEISDIIRQWNYIEQITDIRNGVQCYQALNDSRSIFYDKTTWENGYPAATGIGTLWGGIVIDLIAGKGKNASFAVVPIDNPLQVAAHAYSQSVLLGVKDERVEQRTTPKFERAKIQSSGGVAIGYVSGTAAIRGEGSLENIGIEKQTETTLENIEYLVSQKNVAQHGYSLIRALEVDSMRIYLKYPSDYEAVRYIMNQRYPNVEKLYIEADVCRNELLIEIEAIYNIMQ